MARYLLIALNGPTGGDGDEATYNKWYDEVHAADLMSVPGAVSVRRFAVERENRIGLPYASVTEFEAEDTDALVAALAEKASTFIPEFDRSTSRFVLARERDAAANG